MVLLLLVVAWVAVAPQRIPHRHSFAFLVCGSPHCSVNLQPSRHSSNAFCVSSPISLIVESGPPFDGFNDNNYRLLLLIIIYRVINSNDYDKNALLMDNDSIMFWNVPYFPYFPYSTIPSMFRSFLFFCCFCFLP